MLNVSESYLKNGSQVRVKYITGTLFSAQFSTARFEKR
jgi:hypothetical protein